MNAKIDDLIATLVNGEAGRDRQEAAVALAQLIGELDNEVAYTKEALCDLIQVLQEHRLLTPDMQAIIDRYDAQLARRAHVESYADKIVNKIDTLLSQGKDIEALRCYHNEVGAIWDRCHDVVGMWWVTDQLAKREVVLQDMRNADAQKRQAPPEG
jgi:hypothetical protein